MDGGGDAERARCLLDSHRQNSEVLSHSLLSSELLRASTERFHICFHKRGDEGTDIKRRPRHITPILAVPPTSARSSAVPIGCL